MKLILAVLAACTMMYVSQKANAYPSSDNLGSLIIDGDEYQASRTCTGVGGAWMSNFSCNPGCYRNYGFNFNHAGYSCCKWNGLCNKDQMVKPTEESIVEESATTSNVSNVFDGQQRDSWWGYENSTARSPSAGRGNSPQAKLDACMGHAQVDSYPNMGSLADNSQCRTDCDSSTKNGYCNTTQSENGNSSQTNAACKDRCDCWMNAAYGKSYNCEGL